MSHAAQTVDLLLLGSGWTSRFLVPALLQRGLTAVCTTRSGSPSPHLAGASSSVPVIPFKFADSSDDSIDTASLPRAKLVVIVFPIKESGQVTRLVESYETHHGSTAWLQLGSTGVWGNGYSTSKSPTDPNNARALSESELLRLDRSGRQGRRTAVLNLAGLYGGARQPVNFARRVASSKEVLEKKSSLHLVNGRDVAKGILGMFDALPDEKSRAWGQRWIVSDTNVYDWWQLAKTLRPFPNSSEWADELASQHGVTIPRPAAQNDEQAHQAPRYLDRNLDGDDFWKALGMKPGCGRCDDDDMLCEAEKELEADKAAAL